MVVLSITSCPPSLRGDLSKWLNEINTGVYIGRLSAKVRDELWNRICENIRDGQATMIYSAANAQGYEIRVHNSTWTPVDYDGITLMKRPVKQVQTSENKLKPGFSKAAGYEKARQRRSSTERSYVIMDLETTGLDVDKDRIIELGTIKIIDENITDTYGCFVKQDMTIPDNVKELTGITNEMINEKGVDEEEAIKKLMEFVGKNKVVGYNINFDLSFIRKSCERYKIDNAIKKSMDVLKIARKKLYNVENYKLETVAKALNIEVKTSHRALEDCKLIFETYTKLNML